MNAKKDMDPLQLCRICVVDVSDDTSHSLIENNQITDLGEKFISCLGIQVCVLIHTHIPRNEYDLLYLFLNIAHGERLPAACLQLLSITVEHIPCVCTES